MQCPHCNATLPDESRFCISCGKTLEAESTPAAQTQQPVWASAAAPVADSAASTKTPKPKKAKKKLIVTLICIAVAIALLVGVGALTNWFGLVGPFDQLASATGKTLGAKSFTITGTIYEDYPQFEYVHKNNSYEAVYTGTETYESSLFLQIIIDEKNEDITLYGTIENEDGSFREIAIYDGYSITFDSRRSYYSYYDCSDEIRNFFKNKEKLANAFKELNKAKPDYEDAIDDIGGRGSYDELEDYVEFSEVKGCVKALRKQLNKRSWLKNNVGYSTKLNGITKMHSFHIESLEFLEDLLPLIEPAFANRVMYREAEHELEYITEDEVDIELSLGVKLGKLSLLELTVYDSYNNYDTESTVTIEFSKINSTKIDTDDLEDLLDEAIDYEKNN